jgi:hypothetical protein
MSDFEPTTLALRALNYWHRRSHLSYFSLRAFLLRNNGFDLGISLNSAESLLHRVGIRAFQDMVYKNTSSKSVHTYRNITSLSPHFALLESYLLTRLKYIPATFMEGDVYSYRWPKSKNPSRFFEFYRQYYIERNEKINRALSHDKDLVAVSLDIKSFYPSCPQEKCFSKFYEVVKGQDFSDLACKYVSALFGECENGLPVGPAISHVLANLVMRNIDDQLRQVGSVLYTRYVDDVVFVVSQEKAEDLIKVAKDIFGKEGFVCQQSKTDITTPEEWDRYCPQYNFSIDTNSFENLESRIQMFLLFKPHKSNELIQALRCEGISLNVSWLQSNFTNSRWQKYIRSWKRNGHLRNLLRAVLLDDVNSIVGNCIATRTALITEYQNITSLSSPNSKTASRWQEKKIQYLALRLTQLLPCEDLDEIRESLKQYNFPSISAVLTDLENQKIQEVLNYPGITVDFLCSQWTSSGWDNPKIYVNNQAALYSALSVATQINADIIIDDFEEKNERVTNFLNWLLDRPGFPLAPLETFERELECIMNGLNFEDMLEIIQTTRYSDEEAIDAASFALQVVSSLQS